jgi:hypothetical protein
MAGWRVIICAASRGVLRGCSDGMDGADARWTGPDAAPLRLGPRACIKVGCGRVTNFGRVAAR